ncbi:MAG: threonine--tRNA ligase [Oscillospiraceae bacterium]|nr:threonine--tRNA ligase [Oscillospiraceae bacterium]
MGGDLQAARHSASHVMAQAIKRLYPDSKLAIGPAIADGFYYDIDSDITFGEEQLEAIYAEMKKIIKENLKIERFELSRKDALALMKDEPYKLELINDLPEDEVISFYKQGEFTDLCAGPHVSHTGRLKANAIQLRSVTGAYWRGDSNRKMLQRIYGFAFANKEELDAHLNFLEEAKKRDHRKLGRELGLFALMEEGPGFPFFFPKGMTLKNELLKLWRELHQKAGYMEISTPIILSRSLWERSGHWDNYREHMYTTVIDEQDFVVKPMNCPGGILYYDSEPHSYRELPLRVAELGIVHRHELSGVLHGLMRVREFTQDDAHIFMTHEQIPDEIKGVISLIDEFYGKFGFKYHIELSTMPEKHIGDVELWDEATATLQTALNDSGKDYVINEGDGAFYGPKIDFHLEDCLGRTWQCGTIQLDFNLPNRFDLGYVSADGEKRRPVMIHRVVIGSVERFIGILIEHYAGAFPLWLAPLQVAVLPITDRANDYAAKISAQLEAAGLRAETDVRNEKIGFKIRAAQLQKIPYMLVVGDKEAEAGTVSVRTRSGGDLGVSAFDEVLAKLKEESESRA